VALGRGWEAALSFGRLEFAPATAGTPVGQATVSGPRGEVLLGPWRVRWDTEPAPEQRGRDVPAVWVIPGEYGVRPWRAGDRIWPAGGTGSRLVVRCMQELKVGRRDRAGWPVLTCEEAVIWVPGVSRSEFRMAAPGEEALRIDADRG
jgi:tRNA(Ile)-lysidine synthetase-like protein